MSTLKIYLCLPLILIAVMLTSCDSPSKSTDAAVKVSKEKLANTIGFEWFNTLKNDYPPDQDVVADIKASFDQNIHKIIFFVSPCVSCAGLQDNISALTKTLEEAEISEDFYEYYIIRSTEDTHPYKQLFEIQRLPAAYILTNNSASFSILDSASKDYNKKDVEFYLLDGLK